MTVLRLTTKLALVKPGCMLESLSIPRYEFWPLGQGRDNALGAGNQQERPCQPSHRDRKSRMRQTVLIGESGMESSETVRRAPARVKIQSELHGDMQRPAETTGPSIGSSPAG